MGQFGLLHQPGARAGRTADSSGGKRLLMALTARPYNTSLAARSVGSHEDAQRGGEVAPEGKPRLDPRIAIRLRVDVQYPIRGAHWRRGETYDLSASGSYMRCDLDLPLKAQVGCRLYLPPLGGEEDRLIDFDSVVVRVDAPEPGQKEWRYGLYFLNLNDPDLQAVKKFVFASIQSVT